MTKILLIRHGQSEANLMNVFVGHTDAMLTELGLSQAEETARYLAENEKIDRVYASDLTRAFLTGKALADRLGMEVVPERGMREIDGGDWENVSFETLLREFPEEFGTWLTDLGNAGCSGGETVSELQRRIVATVERLGRENEGKTIAVATHATPVRVLHAYCEGKTADEMKDVPWVSNASVTTLVWEDEHLRLEQAGYDAHLGKMRTELPTGV